MEGLNQILADETETAGKIRVYSVNPGGTRTGMRREAYPLEDPMSLPTPEQHMSLFVFLLAGSLLPGRIARELPATGAQLDARNWQGANQRQLSALANPDTAPGNWFLPPSSA